MNTDSQLSLVPHRYLTLNNEQIAQNDSGNTGCALSYSKRGNQSGWIINLGATDHIIFDHCEFSQASQPRRICTANANGVTYSVTGAGTVALSSSFSLPNTLLILSLSSKLLSIG